MKRTLIFLLLVGGLLALVGGGGVSQGANPLGIVPGPSELQISVWVDKPVYHIGERIHVYFSVNQQAYIYIVDIEPGGRTTLIFPSCYAPNNLMGPGEFAVPPDRWQVAPPAGTEYIQAIASLEPLDLGIPTFAECYPLLGSTPEEAGAAIQGIVPSTGVATAWTSFEIVGGPPPPPANRRPVASFTFSPYNPLVGQQVVFDASGSYDPDGWITGYQWDFDSNGVIDAQGRRVAKTFYVPGNHPVTLTVVDNRGASSSITHAVWVRGYLPPPPAPAAGFYIDLEPGNVLHITVQGSPTWLTDHGYRIELETDGCFTGVHHQISGEVAPLGIVPEPAPRDTLILSGSVSTGKVDYFITLACNATKVKFKLLLDWDGNGDLDLRTDNIYIGPALRHPLSNPFVLGFPSGTLSWASAQICIVLIDQPGFRFIVCFNFNP